MKCMEMAAPKGNRNEPPGPAPPRRLPGERAGIHYVPRHPQATCVVLHCKKHLNG